MADLLKVSQISSQVEHESPSALKVSQISSQVEHESPSALKVSQIAVQVEYGPPALKLSQFAAQVEVIPPALKVSQIAVQVEYIPGDPDTETGGSEPDSGDTMHHASMLRLLSPIELAGVFESDIDLEGAALDAVQESAEALLEEMYPDTAYELLADWERVYDIVPADGATLQSRRDAVVEKMRARGGLSRAYFIGLAAMHGWIITIDEMRAFTAGVSRCGDRLYVPGVRWIWRVNVGSQAIYRFRAGESTAGERLTWWVPNTELEDLLTELKPAHTAVIFNYT